MTWALVEILVPLLLAFGLGLLGGWILWRWRRQRISALEWNQVNASSQSAQAEIASVRAAHAEVLNERKILSARLASLEDPGGPAA